MFKDFSKLLICGGSNPSVTDTCEVINLASSASNCLNLPNFPAKVSGAFGVLGFKENPVICGGLQNGIRSNTCFSLENNEWVSFVDMTLVRSGAAAAQLQNGKLLVAGGYYGSDSALNSADTLTKGGWESDTTTDSHSSAEILTEVGWESSIPSLPVTISLPCLQLSYWSKFPMSGKQVLNCQLEFIILRWLKILMEELF